MLGDATSPGIGGHQAQRGYVKRRTPIDGIRQQPRQFAPVVFLPGLAETRPEGEIVQDVADHAAFVWR
jgi:hypothetical protein